MNNPNTTERVIVDDPPRRTVHYTPGERKAMRPYVKRTEKPPGRITPELVSSAVDRYRAEADAAVPQDPAVRAARDARARRRRQLRKRRGF